MTNVSAIASLAVLVALLICSGCQVLHGYLRIMHSNPHSHKTVTLYEAALLVHLIIMSICAVKPARIGELLPLDMVEIASPFAWILWINLAIAAITAYTAIADPDDSGEPDGVFWMPRLETLIMCCCTPAALLLFGDYHGIAIVVDAFYFLVRCVVLLAFDHKNRRKIVSALAIADAIKQLPEGILYADERGKKILSNDTMHRCLGELGITGNAAAPNALWNSLAEAARNGHDVKISSDYIWKPGSWIALQVNPDEVRLFSFEGEGFDEGSRYSNDRPLETHPPQSEIARELLGSVPYLRAMAYDITPETTIMREIDATNDDLAAVQTELRTSLETIREAAENEAMLHMRARVHDVIGQRLSMLHRALEDNAITDEQIEGLKPLLNGILDDLAADMQIEAADELKATINAFALTEVTINVTGQLPEDGERAKFFADCIREAVTNAVKHSAARNVTVFMSETSLVISNDGLPATGPIVEGTGLTHIRRTAESAGGTMSVALSPFTLRIELPQ